MKKLTLVCVCVLSAMNLMAQKYAETVYLKNGSIIRGDVIEQIPGQSLKIQTRDGSIFVYKMDEVERITKDTNSHKLSGGSTSIYDHGHRGPDFSIEGGVVLSKGGSAMGTGGIEIGKRFSKNFYWGMGVGIMGGGRGDVTVPITTTFKGLFPVTASGIAPNVAFKTGFAVNTEPQADSHWAMFSLMPGIQIPIGNKVDFNLNAGYVCMIATDGGYASHHFMLTTGFGFHKPYNSNEKAETKENGLQIGMDWNPLFGKNFDSALLGANIFIGYKWDSHISFGIGYNHTWMTSPDSHINKVFLNGKYRLFDGRFSPLASVDLGYRGYSRDTYKGKFFFTPAIGGSARVGYNSYLELRLGYEITGSQKRNYYYESYLPNEKVGMSAFSLAIGWTHTLGLFSK